ncbi:hypothetical protein BN1058_01080 [Paraliobacillus sp. PM-2]|uniref:hypothetical protein n=1 Tax=Paraliobacillus sp. PM-2 TaxID=1462524 RepID=UPI00061C6029|nr:hypothetical protein [Paraliobacillus sp. PM-2]CQR46805.1 hypothetical protein BN1058_01080 [Paraliobacillus sp. PM-2]
MKEKILWAGLMLVILSWVGNYLYFESKQLERPIFLDHYYEAYMHDQEQLTFYYLTNKMDNYEVRSLSIDGVKLYPVSDHGFTMWRTAPNTPQFEQEFSHQYLKSVTVELPKKSIPIEDGSKDRWSFEEVNATFSNGQSYTLDLGKVNVYEKVTDYTVLNTHASSSSNQHTSEKSMLATKPITVEDINVPFPENLSEDVYVKVDVNQEKFNINQDENTPEWLKREKQNEMVGISIDEDIFPFHLNKNDRMQLSMQFNPYRKSYFEFSIKISGTSDEGEQFKSKAPIIDHPSLNQQDINEIIEEKQGGNVNEASN